MDEKEQDVQSGRRLEEKKAGLSRKGKIAILSGALAAVVLVGGYLGLCAAASGDRVLPGVCVGGVDLGGMDRDRAQSALDEAAKGRYDDLDIPIQVGDKTVHFSAAKAGVRVLNGADQALRQGKGSFLSGGWNYLMGRLGRKTQLDLAVTVDEPDYIADVLDQVTRAVDQGMEQSRWELQEDEETASLILYRGKTGLGVDRQAVMDALMSALSRGDSAPVQVEIASTAPDEPDFDAVAREVERESVNASLDVATDEIIPHKLGLRMDPDKARALFSGLAEGESAALELEVQLPEITSVQLRSTLFHDVLAEATSKVSGTAARVGNVTLAAAACDGIVLLPGERFSYNQTTGQRTSAKGYRPATGFGMNGTQDMVGGGVCQPSSTLYMACLLAGMDIQERTNHRYTVTYMPEGIDAQVSWPHMDYAFVNNTPYPVKIELKVENKVCTARLYGTKTDDTYATLESVRLGSTAYSTIYKADPSIPQGTTKVLTAPYTGRSVEVYKNLFAADGTLISRTRISKDYYMKCDQVIGYNPADGAPDGSVAPEVDPNAPAAPVDPETGLPVEEGQPTVPVLPSDPAQPVDPGATEQQPADPTVPEGIPDNEQPLVVQPVQPAEPAPEGIPAD